jgi:hypothetical protein
MGSQLSWSIIKQFSGRNVFGFTFQYVAKEFQEKSCAHLGRIEELPTNSEEAMISYLGRTIVEIATKPQYY